MSAAIILGAVFIIAILLALGFAAQQRAIARAPDIVDPAFFQHNPQAMWIYNPESLQFLDVNEAALAQYGFSRKAFLSMHIPDIEQDLHRLQTALENLPDSRISSGWRHRTADGTIIDVELIRAQ